MQVNDHRDLEVWRRACGLAKAAYLLTKVFPKEELYGMVSQIRRAATSILANIAEGWGRHNTAEFNQIHRKANASRTELETHLIVSVEVGLCNQEAIKPLISETTILGKQLVALERSLRQRKES